MFTQSRKTAGTRMRKLHSVHSLLIGREFIGEIEAGKIRYSFAYSPATAAISNGKLELSGRFTVKPSGGQSRKSDNVKATLLATQSVDKCKEVATGIYISPL